MSIQRTSNGTDAITALSDQRLANSRPGASGRMTDVFAKDLASRAPSISALRPATPQIDPGRSL